MFYFAADPATRHNMDKVVCWWIALPHNGQELERAFRGADPHPHRRIPQRHPHQPHHFILIKYLEVYGDIEEAVVITDRSTGKSRGYGFVSATNTVCNLNKYTLTSRQIHFPGDNVKQGGCRESLQGAKSNH